VPPNLKAGLELFLGHGLPLGDIAVGLLLLLGQLGLQLLDLALQQLLHLGHLQLHHIDRLANAHHHTHRPR
jgi:ABC-type microcin C transport system permease subunit YejE